MNSRVTAGAYPPFFQAKTGTAMAVPAVPMAPILCLKWDALLACAFIFSTAFFQSWKGFVAHTPPLPCEDWTLISAFLHILQNAPCKLPSCSSHGNLFPTFCFSSERWQHMMVLYMVSWPVVLHLLNVSHSQTHYWLTSFRLGVADLEEVLKPKKLWISIFSTGAKALNFEIF